MQATNERRTHVLQELDDLVLVGAAGEGGEGGNAGSMWRPTREPCGYSASSGRASWRGGTCGGSGALTERCCGSRARARRAHDSRR
jgi:hypothetical protein